MRFWHPDIELFDPPEFPDADRYVGAEAVKGRAESYRNEGGWDGKFRDIEYLDAGGEVLVLSQLRGSIPRFGGEIPPEVTVTGAQLFLFEDGKVRRVRQFLSREEGVRAAGLAP